MKRRVLSFLLVCVLLLGSVSFAYAVPAAEDSAASVPVTAENEGKRTRILLQWESVPDTDGMQIYRSETGKRGSFEKIATVRGKTSFRDSGLHANHIYFYRLRPFMKTTDGYEYGDVLSVCAATALTDNYLKTQLNEAQKAARDYFDASMPLCKNANSIQRVVQTEDGKKTCRFYEVNLGSIHTVAKLKKYLKTFFSEELVNAFVDAHYCKYKGKLYQLEGEADDPSYIVLNQTSLKRVRQNDTAVTFDAILRSPDLNQEKNTFAVFLGAPKQKQKKNKSTGRIIVNLTEEDWNLTLVNKQRELPRGYEPETTRILQFSYVLDYRVTPHYEQMYQAAKKDGCYLTPYSTYRSYSYQNMLFQNFSSELRASGYSAAEAARITSNQILYPGTSEHQLGFAVDIKGTGQWFAQTKEYRWLKEHAHEYGFIERYTAKKQPITRIIPEPWHWRYVGKPWAEEIKASGLCLEEYLALKGGLYLSERKSFRMVVENGRWVFTCDEDGNSVWNYGNYAYRKKPGV